MLHRGLVGGVDLLESLRLRKCFSCTLEDNSEHEYSVLVLRRRCAKHAIEEK